MSRGSTRKAVKRIAAGSIAGVVLGATMATPHAATTFSDDTPIAIGDLQAASPYPAAITVGGRHGVVKSVVVMLYNLTHSSTGDIDIVLSGPGGQALMLFSDAGAGAASNVTVTISDAAPGRATSTLVNGMMYQPSDFSVSSDVMPAPAPAFVHAAPAGSATLRSTFAGTNPNGDWKIWVSDDASQDTGTIAGGWSIAITTTADQIVDVDGDAKTDFVALRLQAPTDVWHILNGNGYTAIPWGPFDSGWYWMADYDADGHADPVYCTGAMQCYIRLTHDGSLFAPQWGTTGDVPLQPGDYDGDGKADVIVFRPVDGTWYTQKSSSLGLLAFKFGQGGDRPSLGDFDGDGIADYVVFRSGTYYVMQSSAGFFAVPWGTGGDLLVPGDYDGDGKTDAAVVRNTGPNKTFYVRRSSDAGLFAVTWGLATDDVVPGDYDGDGRTDIAVWRDGVFYVRKSGDGTLLVQQWGLGSDAAIADFIVR